MSKVSVRFFEEPTLRFGFDQSLDDPRDGLFFFGPLIDVRHPKQMRVGVVGTPAGLASYRLWVRQINGFIPALRSDVPHHIAYPGFEACFRSAWPEEPVAEIAVSATDIARMIRLSDRHIAINETVSLFTGPIERRLREDDVAVDVWFVIVPDDVYRFGRPLSRVPRAERVEVRNPKLNARVAKKLRTQPSLFAEDMQAAAVYEFDLNFHHQLKARLLDCRAVAQIVRESSLLNGQTLDDTQRRMQDPATVAWNLTTASYYKAGGRPWKLSKLRDGVCYVGLVFKTLPNAESKLSACYGAQMFLDSGDGLVFKGGPGDWYSRENREFHLSEAKARELIETILAEYSRLHGGAPKELFVHGKTRLNEDEWRGIRAAAGDRVNVVGVRISRTSDVKLFRPGRTPVIRGTAYVVHDRRAYLWTSGYVPRLETYAGREVPNPLAIDITQGNADLDDVLADVLALTKLNFNACIYGDGLPVTLRFADAVGEIITARPEFELPPLPFRHYI